MAITRGPQRLQTSVLGRKTNIPAPIHKSSANKQANHPSRKQARASQKTKQPSAKRITSVTSQEVPSLGRRKSRHTQPQKYNKSAVEAKRAATSPRVARNAKKRPSILSATFNKSPKENILEKVRLTVGRRTSSNAEASPCQKSVLKETNKSSNDVPEKSSQSPKKEVHEDMYKKKNEAQPPSIMVAKIASLRHSQIQNSKPPDSNKSRRKVAVEAANKVRSEVKLHSVSKKIVKGKSAIARSSLRKCQCTSISIINTRTAKGYLNISNNADSPSITIADSASLENSPENKTRSSLKPKNLFSDVAKNKKVAEHLSHGQNNISSSRSKKALFKGNQFKEDSDIVRFDNIMPKRKLNEAYIKDKVDALSSANQLKEPKSNDISSAKELGHDIRSNIAEKNNEVEANAPKVKKSKIKNHSSASSKEIKHSTGEKAKNVAGVSKSAKYETNELVPSSKVQKSKIENSNAVSSKETKHSIGDSDRNFAGDSKSGKGEAIESVPLPKVKKSKIKNLNTASNKGLEHSIRGKAKNVAEDLKSSIGETDELVPSPKVKKSGKKKKLDNVPSTQSLRRSVRERFPPCERWHGQRPLFQFKPGQGFVYAGISSGWKKDESARLSILKRLQKTKEKSKIKEATSKPVTKTAVFDRSIETEVDVTLHRPFDSVKWTAVAQGDKIPFHLTKTFVSEKITFGFLDINPLERKGSQYSPEANIHFVVVKGRLKVVIHETEFLFERLDSFIVPRNVAYSIENLEKSKALLSFSTFQTRFFGHQKKKDD